MRNVKKFLQFGEDILENTRNTGMKPTTKVYKEISSLAEIN